MIRYKVIIDFISDDRHKVASCNLKNGTQMFTIEDGSTRIRWIV